jgi:hypothetical protein
MAGNPAGRYDMGVEIGATGGRAVGVGGMERAVSISVGWAAGAVSVGEGAASVSVGSSAGVAGSGLGTGWEVTVELQALSRTNRTIKKIR